ncbi:hypothetical protein CYMTET_29982 [Cymbomonas tetramitiformis]|uniref:Uncharacterized protein n=1 Tax=Cymbomonas tetramitiformis TaxID=36881 RepID=A0AAE0FJR2_9CHLO|nr:hypothetical protein CYMTET_29982 [Cymbomonas tetramitiformis]
MSARNLQKEAPHATAKRNGESEGAKWWDQHAALFSAAWKELGSLDPSVTQLQPSCLHPQMAAALKKDPHNLAENMRGTLTEVIPGVYSFPLFTEEFCAHILAEMDHRESSGIPIRRPNGVRYTASEHQTEGYEVRHRMGWALLHHGGHVHEALPITEGERINLILWGLGEGGVVRIRPRAQKVLV